MTIKLDVATSYLPKRGEEVCGDTSEVIRGNDATTIIFSDGLGSGIKASILSILTTKIASGLLQRRVEIEEVFETIADTLPICKVRNLAYSTLSILQIFNDGTSHLIEYDNPPLIFLRNGEEVPLERRERFIAGKPIQESSFQVEVGDLLILMSDGVTNAGVGGGLFKLGIGYDGLIDNIVTRSLYIKDSKDIADEIVELIDLCYLFKPGDDSTVVVMKVRSPKSVVVLTGPPGDPALDSSVVSKFLSFEGAAKVVCGGATGNMVAREVGRPIKTYAKYEDPSVPPTATIEGIDMVTEGILTLNKCIEKIENIKVGERIGSSRDGATLLAKTLLGADKVTFLIGEAINIAHEEFMQSLQLKPRTEAVGRLADLLTEMGKEIELQRF
jgi:hypothetical protein